MEKIFFISGHLDLTQGEFDKYYRDAIDYEINKGSSFVMGDAKGADTMAQQYLHNRGYNKVTIYHMFDKPRNNIGNFKTIGGFKSDKKRDTACTENSMFDIMYVSPYKQYMTGTEENIRRRAKQIYKYVDNIETTLKVKHRAPKTDINNITDLNDPRHEYYQYTTGNGNGWYEAHMR